MIPSDESSVCSAMAVLERLLANEGGSSVGEAVRELESITDRALAMVRSEKALSEGLDRYARLEEKLETLTLAGKSLLYNRELLGALALRNQLACSRVAVKMALERKESRGLHLREDYPWIDNEAWQVRQLVQLVDGTDRLSKKAPVVTRVPLRKPEKVDYEAFILEEDLGMKNMEAK